MAEIAARSGVKPNFGGGGIRDFVERAGVMKADKVYIESSATHKCH